MIGPSMSPNSSSSYHNPPPEEFKIGTTNVALWQQTGKRDLDDLLENWSTLWLPILETEAKNFVRQFKAYTKFCSTRTSTMACETIKADVYKFLASVFCIIFSDSLNGTCSTDELMTNLYRKLDCLLETSDLIEIAKHQDTLYFYSDSDSDMRSYSVQAIGPNTKYIDVCLLEKAMLRPDFLSCIKNVSNGATIFFHNCTSLDLSELPSHVKIVCTKCTIVKLPPTCMKLKCTDCTIDKIDNISCLEDIECENCEMTSIGRAQCRSLRLSHVTLDTLENFTCRGECLIQFSKIRTIINSELGSPTCVKNCATINVKNVTCLDMSLFTCELLKNASVHKCQKLVCNNCPELENISDLPEIKKFSIRRCGKLKKFPNMPDSADRECDFQTMSQNLKKAIQSALNLSPPTNLPEPLTDLLRTVRETRVILNLPALHLFDLENPFTESNLSTKQKILFAKIHPYQNSNPEVFKALSQCLSAAYDELLPQAQKDTPQFEKVKLSPRLQEAYEAVKNCIKQQNVQNSSPFKEIEAKIMRGASSEELLGIEFPFSKYALETKFNALWTQYQSYNKFEAALLCNCFATAYADLYLKIERGNSPKLTEAIKIAKEYMKNNPNSAADSPEFLAFRNKFSYDVLAKDLLNVGNSFTTTELQQNFDTVEKILLYQYTSLTDQSNHEVFWLINCLQAAYEELSPRASNIDYTQ